MDGTDPSTLAPWVAAAAAFALGSVPFGLLIARLFQVKDLRDRGSGNIGATNVSRVLGFWPAGALTFALDLVKGAVPILLLRPAGTELWAGALDVSVPELSPLAVWSVGLAAVLGHCYSPWLRFRGGKGVATGLGAILVLSPWAGLVGLAGFALAFMARRIGSLSSLAGLAAASVAHLVLYPAEAHLWAGAGMVFVILLRHESNLDALLENREKAF